MKVKMELKFSWGQDWPVHKGKGKWVKGLCYLQYRTNISHEISVTWGCDFTTSLSALLLEGRGMRERNSGHREGLSESTFAPLGSSFYGRVGCPLFFGV